MSPGAHHFDSCVRTSGLGIAKDDTQPQTIFLVFKVQRAGQPNHVCTGNLGTACGTSETVRTGVGATVAASSESEFKLGWVWYSNTIGPQLLVGFGSPARDHNHC